jgi:UDP-N-acetylglucosamine diphosphorylase/glucosamine-1-phosphate N-acetyltransferase
MIKIGLFEDKELMKFFPLAMTRHISQLKWGVWSIGDKWRKLGFDVVQKSDRPLFNHADSNVERMVNGRYIPNESLLSAFSSLKVGEGWTQNGIPVVCRVNQGEMEHVRWEERNDSNWIGLMQLSDLFVSAKERLIEDACHFSARLPQGVANQIIGDSSLLMVSESAKVNGCFLNTTEGPIIIDDEAEVMEGCMIRGPFYLGKGATLKMGAKIYGATVIGEHCKVGGEVGNSVIFGYSNKAHDGFIGNAIIGEWCNLGADTNCSNLKNNYSVVKQYSYFHGKEVNTGLTFCGLVMGDFSKCGINTMFNTGTVVGVGANVYGGGFLPKHLPSFYWGDAESATRYELPKFLETVALVKSRRKLNLSDFDIRMLTDLHKDWAYSINEGHKGIQ